MSDQVFVPPVLRPDSAPLDPNPVRRFREELRLDREQFVKLLGGIPVATLRGWEEQFESIHYHAPRAEFIQKLADLAQRNRYPLFYDEITPKGNGNLYVLKLKVGTRATEKDVAQSRMSLTELISRAR